ncbi:MAG: inositol 2-dehydrogenase [Bacteroidota bacterium]
MTSVGIIGLGRIGRIHLKNLCTQINGVMVIGAMNPSADGRDFAAGFNLPIVTDNPDELIHHPAIDAILVCTPTDLHADYVVRAAKAGKAVFCEKPIDLSLERVRKTLAQVEQAGTPLMLAFNQRFDPHFQEIRKGIEEGKIGRLRSIHITSRDPSPPPISYIQQSGGLFMDMSIHDLDMARYLLNDEIVEVYAKGFNIIDPEIGAVGDIDTGYILLTSKNQVTVFIENSRQASYGYDQRLEVFGSKGMMMAENPLKTNHVFLDSGGMHRPRNQDFFIDRYAESYKAEMHAFVEALNQKKPMPITGEDGLQAMLLALAAEKSMKENRPVRLAEIGG